MTYAHKTATCLWFEKDGEAAAKLYTSLLPNSRITGMLYYDSEGPQPKGSVLTVTFELDGAEYIALNGTAHFTLSPAASIVIKCDSQAEVDRLWAALLKDGGQESQCGWLTDRFGLTWQIVPAALYDMLADTDTKRTQRVFTALRGMIKLDLAALQKAYDGA